MGDAAGLILGPDTALAMAAVLRVAVALLADSRPMAVGWQSAIWWRLTSGEGQRLPANARLDSAAAADVRHFRMISGLNVVRPYYTDPTRRRATGSRGLDAGVSAMIWAQPGAMTSV